MHWGIHPPRDCPSTISQASGRKIPALGKPLGPRMPFQIHPSSRQYTNSIITYSIGNIVKFSELYHGTSCLFLVVKIWRCSFEFISNFAVWLFRFYCSSSFLCQWLLPQWTLLMNRCRLRRQFSICPFVPSWVMILCPPMSYDFLSTHDLWCCQLE